MEGAVGAEVSQKIRAAIKAKLTEIGVYVDEELPDYVMVMVANKRSREQMQEDLKLFLGKDTVQFTIWLHSILQKLQEVTVASTSGAKKKVTEEPKKKKKLKQESEKKELTLKKKIKVEPEDDVSSSQKKDAEEISRIDKTKTSISVEETVSSTKTNSTTEKRASIEKEATKSDEKLLESITTEEEEEDSLRATQNSTSNGSEDLDDEDCINIRTDGELLDTNEDPNIEEVALSSPIEKEPDDKKSSSKKSFKRTRSNSRSPSKAKDKSKSKSIEKSRKTSEKDALKTQVSNKNEKVVDARELLNRKKAAKESESKGRSKSKERSTSPKRRREDERESNRTGYSGRDMPRRGARVEEKDSSSRRTNRRDDDRVHRSRSRSRDRRADQRFSRRTVGDKIESRDRRRSLSNDPPSKRPHLEKSVRSKIEDTRTSRLDRSLGSRRDTEEGRKRGLVSRVVARPLEPEEEVDAPVPSVVKVTPRPSRPANQGPSSTLILKAISEANRSLANAPPRPDSTQRAEKGAVLQRVIRNQNIPREKIAVSITNNLALKSVTTAQPEDEDAPMDEEDVSRSPRYDETARNKSPVMELEEENVPKPEVSEKKPKTKERQVPVLEAEDAQMEEELPMVTEEEECDDKITEVSDPQFVVTLNGYDPDGLFVGMDVEGEGEEWLREGGEPLLTSTPPNHGSPPSLNTNLIEVDVKSKVGERCKYWPACRLLDKCTFYHPTKLCNMFPNCKFGDSCLYIHPQCKYNALCTRKDCIFAHTTAHTPLQPAVGTKVKTLYAASALQPCRFYPNCTNTNCQFAHPTRACRFGSYCTKKDCAFDHGKVAPIDKLKWTRVPST